MDETGAYFTEWRKSERKTPIKYTNVVKITRPFRYDLNQIPYDYTMEVRNRFKGLDLIDRLPDELPLLI